MLKALITKALLVLILAAAPLFANFWITGETFTQAAAADMPEWVQKSPPLHQAAWSNDLDKVKQLIADGADVNAKGLFGKTPLHCAAWGNAREAAVLLLERGADVHAKGLFGKTPLHGAAQNNSREVAVLLLANGADVNAQVNNGSTPLHDAARSNSHEVAVLLLANGADTNAKRSQGGFLFSKTYYLTPLEFARYWKRQGYGDTSDMIELLTNGLAAARAQPKVQPAKD